MDIKDFLNTVCNHIKYKAVRNPISLELESHIYDLKEDYMMYDNKLKEEEAIKKAINHMGNPDEIGKRLNKIHKPKFDFILVFLVLGLISFGVLLSYNLSNDSYQMMHWFEKTIFNTVVGVVFGIGFYFIDYTKLKKYSLFFYICATAIILLSYITGHMINGISYLSVGGFSFSPITLALPLYILSFVGFLNQYDIRKKKDVAKLLLEAFLSLGLILLHPSLASCFILCLIYITLVTFKMWNLKGLRKRYLSFFYSGILLVGLFGFILIVRICPLQTKSSSFLF